MRRDSSHQYSVMLSAKPIHYMAFAMPPAPKCPQVAFIQLLDRAMKCERSEMLVLSYFLRINSLGLSLRIDYILRIRVLLEQYCQIPILCRQAQCNSRSTDSTPYGFVLLLRHCYWKWKERHVFQVSHRLSSHDARCLMFDGVLYYKTEGENRLSCSQPYLFLD